jgi:GTP-binding protein
MKILSAEFIMSNTQISKCPTPDKPEFAFIGRSNVGKSSLLNMLASRKELARTSAKPGKTQTINHYLVNQNWYLVDLPGYGYAGVSRTAREGWGKMIETYLTKRENLYCTFILIDSRLEPQKIDLEFIRWMGEKRLPIAILFTKCDKNRKNALAASQKKFKETLLKTWEELPPFIVTSAEKKIGRDEVLDFIQNAMDSQIEIS